MQENISALKAVASISMSLNLIFAIPPLIISIPTLPLRNIYMRIKEQISSKIVMTLVATLLAGGSAPLIAVISDLTIFMAESIELSRRAQGRRTTLPSAWPPCL